MKNQDIKEEAKAANVKLWKIADKMKMTDSNFSKKLRYELTEKEKLQIRLIIAELAEEARE